MSVRQIFPMSNNIKQGDQEGICTAISLVWAKKCIERRRGLGSYIELGVDDHALNGLMAVWRRFDHDPVQQTHAFGLRVVGGGDQVLSSIRAMHDHFVATAPHVGIFFNNYHTMGYRVGKYGKVTEYEWFDKNFGYFVSTDENEMHKFMREKWKAWYPGYEGSVKGCRVVEV